MGKPIQINQNPTYPFFSSLSPFFKPYCSMSSPWHNVCLWFPITLSFSDKKIGLKLPRIRSDLLKAVADKGKDRKPGRELWATAVHSMESGQTIIIRRRAVHLAAGRAVVFVYRTGFEALVS